MIKEVQIKIDGPLVIYASGRFEVYRETEADGDSYTLAYELLSYEFDVFDIENKCVTARIKWQHPDDYELIDKHVRQRLYKEVKK